MKVSELKLGQHFWAIMDSQLVAMCKLNDGCFVCGGWECAIYEEEFIIIELINFPDNYSSENLYYK